MNVLMKYSGKQQKCHLVSDELAPLCGLPYEEGAWGCFDIPVEMITALPICGSCNQKIHPSLHDLHDRSAAHGWTLRMIGVEYELTGNGAPAYFRSDESLIAWLDHQEREKHATED